MYQNEIVINIDYRLFLDSFEDFCIVYITHINGRRKDKGLQPLTDDEQTNLFLYLRKKNGIDK
jgi:hypothetical protein